jgi:hypothetical protein
MLRFGGRFSACMWILYNYMLIGYTHRIAVCACGLYYMDIMVTCSLGYILRIDLYVHVIPTLIKNSRICAFILSDLISQLL